MNERDSRSKTFIMELMFADSSYLFAAAGYSLVYLLAGGGFLGAIVIYFVARMFGA